MPEPSSPGNPGRRPAENGQSARHGPAGPPYPNVDSTRRLRTTAIVGLAILAALGLALLLAG